MTEPRRARSDADRHRLPTHVLSANPRDDQDRPRVRLPDHRRAEGFHHRAHRKTGSVADDLGRRVQVDPRCRHRAVQRIGKGLMNFFTQLVVICGGLCSISAALVLLVKPIRERVLGTKDIREGQRCLCEQICLLHTTRIKTQIRSASMRKRTSFLRTRLTKHWAETPSSTT